MISKVNEYENRITQTIYQEMLIKNKAKNMPVMIKRVIDIIDMNPGKRGLVHTGNYGIMNELKRMNHPRIITYGNSVEKDIAIKRFKEHRKNNRIQRDRFLRVG